MLRTFIAIGLLLPAACIGIALGAEVAICTASSDQVDPDVDGRYVVWEDHRATPTRVYLYDIESGTAELLPLLSGATGQYQPAVSGGHVVYVSTNTTAHEVCLYSIADRTTTVVRSGTNHLADPDVHSTKDEVAVVWAEYVQNDPDGAANSEIWILRWPHPGIPTTKQFSSGGFESDPRIAGDWVVWMHMTEDPGIDSYRGPYDVFARQVGMGGPVLVSSTTAGERNLLPDVSNSRVVWMATPEIDDFGARVLASNLPPGATGPTTLRPLPSGTPADSGIALLPAISGDTVVYIRDDFVAHDKRLMVFEPVTGLDYAVSASTTVSNPRTDGTTVVWQDDRAGNCDIYMAKTGPTEIAGCTVIDEPGYYVLAADILDSACDTAIEIRCPDVLLDGQGHLVDGRDIIGTGGILAMSPGGSDPLSNVAVRDVRLTDWYTGFSGRSCSGSTLSNVTATSGHLGIGFSIDCDGIVLDRCTASSNADAGIEITENCGLTMTRCTVRENAGDGVKGYQSSVDCRDSLVAENGGNGFGFSRAGGDIVNSTIRDNAGSGILFNPDTAPACTIAGNSITGNALGISDVNIYSGGRTVYNNHFNNTINVDSGAMNTWSVAATPGPNIVGGPSIGGNYWAQPDGHGFSQTHADADGDGFCDDTFVVTTAGDGMVECVDLLPLHLPGPAPPLPLPGLNLPPLDTDGDGKFDDVNGNGRADFADVVLYFNQMTWIAANEPVGLFDYNGNGRIDFADVVWLFNNL